jgi:cbb3-type cytochrome oxidase cytochrome c subunit
LKLTPRKSSSVAMTEKSVSELSDAFKLIASLEAHCKELRRMGAADQHVCQELEALLAEIRGLTSTMTG